MANTQKRNSAVRHWTTSGELSHISGMQTTGERRAAVRQSKPVASLRVLLYNVVDYAGLFPPAALDMKTAVRNFLAYQASDTAWMLGRFVVPASRLSEFSETLEQTSGE